MADVEPIVEDLRVLVEAMNAESRAALATMCMANGDLQVVTAAQVVAWQSAQTLAASAAAAPPAVAATGNGRGHYRSWTRRVSGWDPSKRGGYAIEGEWTRLVEAGRFEDGTMLLHKDSDGQFTVLRVSGGNAEPVLKRVGWEEVADLLEQVGCPKVSL